MIVIPGGTSGMGFDLVRQISKTMPVLIGGQNDKRLTKAVADIEAEGGKVYGKTVDISDRKSLDEFAEYAK